MIPKPSSTAPTLKERVLRAGGWSFTGFALSQAIRFGSNLLMTRLLVPEMFGIMAIVTMVTVMIWVLSDIGLYQNIVQSRRGDDPMFLDTAWAVQIVRGTILWLVALVLSIALHLANGAGLFPAEAVYASPALPLVIAVSSFSIVIQSFGSTRMATAHRNFNQKRVTQIDLVGQVSGLIVMIVAGILSRSIWALVAGGLVASMTTTILSYTWLDGHLNRFRWEKKSLRELIGFGRWVLASSILGALVNNGDRLLLGGMVSANTLGLYSIAILITGAVSTLIQKLLGTIVYPAVSEVARGRPEDLKKIYYKFRAVVDLFSLFCVGFLWVAGAEIVSLLYDDRYHAAGRYLEILAWSLLFSARLGISGQCYLALGKPVLLTAHITFSTVTLYVSLPIAHYYLGLDGALWAIALSSLPAALLTLMFNYKNGLLDIRQELILLSGLPIGVAAGYLFDMMYARFSPFVVLK